MVKPEDNNNTVFNNGKENESTTFKFKGGQIPPSSTPGNQHLWKKAQKNLKKKKTSEIIIKNIAIYIFLATTELWKPLKDSIITSHHQNIKTNNKTAIDNKINWKVTNWWKYKTVFNNKHKIAKEVIIGQGLRSTKWKGILFIIFIFFFFRFLTKFKETT
jgi:hypothetical protein